MVLHRRVYPSNQWAYENMGRRSKCREMKIKLSNSTSSPELQRLWKIEKKKDKERSRDGEWENIRKQARRRRKGEKERKHLEWVLVSPQNWNSRRKW